jgi:predicted metal-binding membrane protein
MPSPTGPTLRLDQRVTIVASVALVTILAWAYVVHVARMPGMAGAPMGDMAGMPGMADMPGMEMPASSTPTATFLELFLMWTAMMVGMMLPSVLPNVLLFSSIAKQRQGTDRPQLSTPQFVSGYLLAWVGFSLVAALIQTRLRTALLPSAETSRAAAIAAGALLVLTGIYQWTRFKAACLAHCRSPIGHLTAHWREGRFAPLSMGLQHGLVCVGCCWLLMALLFVGGVMNPYWVGGLALLVILEKLVPRGEVLGRLAGVGLVVWGVVVVLR